jgi:hypothetical protein
VFSASSADFPIPGHGREDPVERVGFEGPGRELLRVDDYAKHGLARAIASSPRRYRELAVPGCVELCSSPIELSAPRCCFGAP